MDREDAVETQWEWVLVFQSDTKWSSSHKGKVLMFWLWGAQRICEAEVSSWDSGKAITVSCNRNEKRHAAN